MYENVNSIRRPRRTHMAYDMVPPDGEDEQPTQ
jgi:hypothetical protein